MNRPAGGVLIMAGGTGGHIFPGLAVAECLRRQQVPVRWLGAKGGMECQRVAAAGFVIDAVEISGLRGKGLTRWLRLPVHLLKAVRQAFVLLGQHRPACALSFGGYAAGPGGLAARLRGVPLLVHEQNRIPGLTNRVLACLAQRVLQAFPGTWPQRLRAITCGNPVRQAVAGLPPPAERLQHHSGQPRLLVLGGSQGARALNSVLPQAIARLRPEVVPAIHHQAGKGWGAQTAQAYAAAGVTARVEEFIEDMAPAYAWADLVVCRAGAMTISELAAAGIGAILVPFPHAVDDHQTRNAEFLTGVGAARLLPEQECDAQSLGNLLQELLGDRQALLHMASSARAVAMPDAADRVAHACMEYVRP
jgi:UDP-N-acetylglucosamine--N-acetylmuramyl-(pentapeptide) pyrophosphoryl-undecaprenol N-acetylglucosamine transferase